MNINFNDATFEKLRFLAEREDRSVAAFVSMRMDELAGQLVNTTFSINNVPAGTPLAHLDPTPRPAPRRPDEDYQYDSFSPGLSGVVHGQGDSTLSSRL